MHLWRYLESDAFLVMCSSFWCISGGILILMHFWRHSLRFGAFLPTFSLFWGNFGGVLFILINFWRYYVYFEPDPFLTAFSSFWWISDVFFCVLGAAYYLFCCVNARKHVPDTYALNLLHIRQMICVTCMIYSHYSSWSTSFRADMFLICMIYVMLADRSSIICVI